MPALLGCDESLVVFIEGLGEGPALSTTLDIVGDVDTRISSSGAGNPIPNTTVTTDHSRRDPDEVSFNAIAGCRGCSGGLTVLPIINAIAKRAQARQVYDTTFFNIFWNTGVATNMRLVDYRSTQSQNSVQGMNLFFVFQAVELAGEISAPSYRAGGVLGFG